MGMDIHAFIEYETGLGSASSFAKVNISRNYQLFKVLDSFPIRGLSDNLGSAVQREFFVPVIDLEKKQVGQDVNMSLASRQKNG